MKKTKTQKGITLVALVITIIVLLILAVVAIGAVRNSGIIGHAQNSADRYNSGKAEESSILGDYENEISKYYGDEDLEKTELYGSKVYGIEFITETTGKFYIPGINDNGYLEVTFSDNKIMYDGEVMGEYSIHTLENNKILIMNDDEFFTTNGAVGMDNSLLDGRIYIKEGNIIDTIKFEEGNLHYKSSTPDKYYICDSYILREAGIEGVFIIFAKGLSEDLTTFAHSSNNDVYDTYTLQQ